VETAARSRLIVELPSGVRVASVFVGACVVGVGVVAAWGLAPSQPGTAVIAIAASIVFALPLLLFRPRAIATSDGLELRRYASSTRLRWPDVDQVFLRSTKGEHRLAVLTRNDDVIEVPLLLRFVSTTRQGQEAEDVLARVRALRPAWSVPGGSRDFTAEEEGVVYRPAWWHRGVALLWALFPLATGTLLLVLSRRSVTAVLVGIGLVAGAVLYVVAVMRARIEATDSGLTMRGLITKRLRWDQVGSAVAVHQLGGAHLALLNDDGLLTEVHSPIKLPDGRARVRAAASAINGYPRRPEAT
jgi:hypothetical protein